MTDWDKYYMGIDRPKNNPVTDSEEDIKYWMDTMKAAFTIVGLMGAMFVSFWFFM